MQRFLEHTLRHATKFLWASLEIWRLSARLVCRGSWSSLRHTTPTMASAGGGTPRSVRRSGSMVLGAKTCSCNFAWMTQQLRR